MAPSLLPEVLADALVAYRPGHPLRVAVDGAPAAEPERWASALVDPLRLRGRSAAVVGSRWFLRPASVRLEHGRTDPDGYYEDWLDAGGLRREVLDRVGPVGEPRYLPTLWDPERDRATRAGYVTVAADSVLLVAGSLLLGHGLPFDVSVHLWLSAGALDRRTGVAERWTLPAFARYEREVRPVEVADLVVRMDDPARPAVQYRQDRAR